MPGKPTNPRMLTCPNDKSGEEQLSLLTARQQGEEVKGKGDEGDGGLQVLLLFLCLPSCMAPARGGWRTESAGMAKKMTSA